MKFNKIIETYKLGSPGTQTVTLRGVYRLSNRDHIQADISVRIHISIDTSYHNQSSATGEMWGSDKWNNIVQFDHSQIQRIAHGVMKGNWDQRIHSGLTELRDQMLKLIQDIMV